MSEGRPVSGEGPFEVGANHPFDVRLVRLARRWLPARLTRFLSRLLAAPERLDAADLALTLLARSLLRERYPGAETDTLEIHRHELKVWSQNGEDGILLWLFSRMGTTNRVLVEIGCGDGRECNGANLVLTWGWRGLFLDADDDKLARARSFFGRALGPRADAARCVGARVTRENVDDLLGSLAPTTEPDLLSIDVDGNDFWIWQALTVLRPRAVVIEYNAAFGHERAVTIPYDPGFDRLARHPSGLYHGASLKGLASLGRLKGYRLIGCDSEGVNAFFVRADQAGDLAEVAPELAFRPYSHRHAPWNPDQQRDLIAGLPLVEV